MTRAGAPLSPGPVPSAVTIGALDLMQRALDLLDDHGAETAALHLQHAIDIARAAPIPRSIDEADVMLALPEVRALDARLTRRQAERRHDHRG